MNHWHIGWAVAILQLATTFLLLGLWTPWTWFAVFGSSLLVQSLLFIANILFLVLPVLAVIGLWKRSTLAFLALATFPVCAWVFGVVPIPCLSSIFTSDIEANSMIITIIDVLAVMFGVGLFGFSRMRSNNALHLPP